MTKNVNEPKGFGAVLKARQEANKPKQPKSWRKSK